MNLRLTMAMIALILASTVSVQNCGIGKSLFNISQLSISPTNPTSGDPLTLHMQYTVPQGMVVTGGTATYAMKYNFIPISPTVESLCSNIPCPLGPGIYTNDTVTTWPSGISGRISTKITWADSNNTMLACLSIDGKSR